jgi:Tol biopolymer transport system component
MRPILHILASLLALLTLASCGDDLVGSPPNTSADKERIYFTTWDPAQSSYGYVASVLADGTEERAETDSDWFLSSSPRNGRYAVSKLYWDGSIYLANSLMIRDTSGAIGLPYMPAGPLVPQVILSPDGRTVAFYEIDYQFDPSGTIVLMIAPANDLNAAQVVLPVGDYVGLFEELNASNRIAFSPDGTRIAFTDFGYPFSLYVVRLDDIKQIAMLDIGVGPHIAWSPRSDRIAYERLRFDSNQSPVGFALSIRSSDPEDKTPGTPIAGSISSYEYITWSPDGRSLAYVQANSYDTRIPDGFIAPSELYVMNVDGYNQRNYSFAPGTVESSRGVQRPQWSSDNRRILYTETMIEGGLRTSSVKIVDIGTGATTTVRRNAYAGYWER